MDRNTYLVALAIVVPLVTVTWRKFHSKDHPPYPPGPKPDFIVGNARQFPQDRWVETFTEWQKAYGDMIYINILGNNILIINSLDIAKELLVKRGNNYSGRARIPIVTEVMDWEWSLVTVQAGDFHANGRTIFRKAIGEREVVQYDDIILGERDNLIEAIASVQGDPTEVIREMIGATVLKISYGESVYKAHGEALTQMNREVVDISVMASTRFWLVNFIPSLHYLPDWLPFTFKKLGKRGKFLTRQLRYWAWDQTVQHFNEGIAGPSIAVDYLERDEKLETVRDTLGLVYGAGVDNTVSTLLTFIANLLLHPHVQKTIHEELDRVLDDGQMPTFNDRAKLRYLDAAWRESIRLHPTTVVGVPHRSEQDDIYNGMYIPGNSMLITNVAFMFRDPRLWDDPDTFKPERWLPQCNPNAASLPDTDWVFGFGRRVCPGQYLADRTGFVFVASLLKAYTMAPLPGEDLPEEYVYHDALIRYPEDVKCRFIPRM